MSAKVKLISFISAFILVLGIMIIGVLSAEQVKVNIGGSVSFNATNVYAKVSGDISGAEIGNKTFSTLTYSASETKGDESDWTNLALEFTETPDPIIITITVENLSTQRTLTVNLENTLQGEGLDIAVTSESDSYTSGTNVELPVSTGDGSSTTTFTLILTVANPDQSLTDVNFGYILNMYDESSAPIAFTFTTSGSNATLTSYKGTDTKVVIPSTISLTPDGTAIEGSDYTVTAIAAGSESSGPFYSVQSTLTSITIPETIETIDNYAFYNCTALTEINYNATNASDLSFGNDVFYNAGQDGTGITVNIGANVTRLPNYIFSPYSGSSAPNITAVNFAEGSVCESIGGSAFYQCRSLTSITIPSSVTSIGSNAFNYCYALAEVYNYSNLTITQGTSNSSVGYLGQYAKVVYNASDLTGVKPETRITVVDKMQYYNYSDDFIALAPISRNVTEVSLDNRTTEINIYAFDDYFSLISVNFGDNSQLTSIGAYAFFRCSSLTSITIPDSVTRISGYAFYQCSSLTSITIGEDVTTIGDRAFDECTALTEINYNATAANNLISQNGVFGSAGQYGTGITLNIGANVTKIPNYIFYPSQSAARSLPNITAVNFAEGSVCESIGKYAFYQCSSLTSITIPKGVKSIGTYAFRGCHALAEVYNYSSLTIPQGTSNSSVGDLGEYAKVVYNASDLSSGKPATRIQVVDNVQYYNYGDDFIALAPTSRYVTEVILKDTTNEINQYAFDDCSSLTSITVGEGVTSIGSWAFADCSSLNKVTVESDDIYLDLTSQSACEDLIYYVNDTGDTVKVLKSVVDSVDPDFTVNTYLNGSNFTRSVSEDGLYYVYTHI